MVVGVIAVGGVALLSVDHCVASIESWLVVVGVSGAACAVQRVGLVFGISRSGEIGDIWGVGIVVVVSRVGVLVGVVVVVGELGAVEVVSVGGLVSFWRCLTNRFLHFWRKCCMSSSRRLTVGVFVGVVVGVGEFVVVEVGVADGLTVFWRFLNRFLLFWRSCCMRCSR